ncbi:MAG: hypothetical protein ACLFQV_02355, partial [Vulcanimicrobiota bacterium]
MTLLSFTKLAEDPEKLRMRQRHQLNECQNAMYSISVSLRKYSRDHDGKFPKSLQWLIPDYIRKIPENPAALKDTFSPGYEVSDDQLTYTIQTKGNYFEALGIEKNFPIFTSKYKYVQTKKKLEKLQEEEEPVIEEEIIEPEENKTEKEETKEPEVKETPSRPGGRKGETRGGPGGKGGPGGRGGPGGGGPGGRGGPGGGGPGGRGGR